MWSHPDQLARYLCLAHLNPIDGSPIKATIPSKRCSVEPYVTLALEIHCQFSSGFTDASYQWRTWGSITALCGSISPSQSMALEWFEQGSPIPTTEQCVSPYVIKRQVDKKHYQGL